MLKKRYFLHFTILKKLYFFSSEMLKKRYLFSQKDVGSDGQLQLKPIYMLPFAAEEI